MFKLFLAFMFLFVTTAFAVDTKPVTADAVKKPVPVTAVAHHKAHKAHKHHKAHKAHKKTQDIQP